MALYNSAALLGAVFKTKVTMQSYSFGRTSATLPFSQWLPTPNNTETGVSTLFYAKPWECFRTYLP